MPRASQTFASSSSREPSKATRLWTNFARLASNHLIRSFKSATGRTEINYFHSNQLVRFRPKQAEWLDFVIFCRSGIFQRRASPAHFRVRMRLRRVGKRSDLVSYFSFRIASCKSSAKTEDNATTPLPALHRRSLISLGVHGLSASGRRYL